MSIYAVNGKEPIAAWIPSLDTAGNGTTTLTDLTGNGYSGLLTNMDAATDWVSDTDAGGVRALDFDGINDWVRLTAPSTALSADFAISLFFKPNNISSAYRLLWETQGYRASTGGLAIYQNGSALEIWRHTVAASPAFVRIILASGVITASVWQHIALVRNGGTMSLFRNGSLWGSGADSQDYDAGNLTLTYNLGGGRTLFFFTGRIDDCRLWSEVIDATDIADLYAGGFGRGIVAPAGKKRPRINGSLINSGLCRSSAS